MSEIFQNYTWQFASGIILPIIISVLSIFGAYINGKSVYENLKIQLNSDKQNQRIEDGVFSTKFDIEIMKNGIINLNEKLSDSEIQLRLLQSYDSKLNSANQKDALITALISQYQKQIHSLQLTLAPNINLEEQKGEVAKIFLNMLNDDIVKTTVRNDLPGNPLIIGIAQNSFRVIFSSPMRIPPKLTFKNLPEGVQNEVTDLSNVSFTVTFYPLNVPVHNFGFTAEAEL